MIMLQSWRANFDVKVLFYDTNPFFSDMKEIADVSSYVVQYTCKVHLTLNEEKNIIASSIKRYVHVIYLRHV